MRRAELLDLAQRVEDSTFLDRAIDHAIDDALDCPDGGFSVFLPMYVSNIASLVQSIKDTLPDAFWQVGHDGAGEDPSMFLGRVTRPIEGVGRTHWLGLSVTPEGALGAAWLRALAATINEGDA